MTDTIGAVFVCPHCSMGWTVPDLTPDQAIGENRNICQRCRCVGVVQASHPIIEATAGIATPGVRPWVLALLGSGWLLFLIAEVIHAWL